MRLVTPNSEDEELLAARVIREQGLRDGALMIPRADAEAAIVAAYRLGVQSGTADEGRTCRVCGCGEFTSCGPEPCAWAGDDLCTACAPAGPP